MDLAERGKQLRCPCGWEGAEEIWKMTTEGMKLDGFRAWCPDCGLRLWVR